MNKRDKSSLGIEKGEDIVSSTLGVIERGVYERPSALFLSPVETTKIRDVAPTLPQRPALTGSDINIRRMPTSTPASAPLSTGVGSGDKSLALLAEIASLKLRIADLEDDFIDQGSGGGGGSSGGFTGVMLAGFFYAPEDIEDTRPKDKKDEGFLCIDMRLLKVYWSVSADTEWYVDCIPAFAVTGLITYPIVPHYVEGEL